LLSYWPRIAPAVSKTSLSREYTDKLDSSEKWSYDLFGKRSVSLLHVSRDSWDL